MKKLFFTIASVWMLLWSEAFAQTRNPAVDINRANIWHFGSGTGVGIKNAPSIHFDSGYPIVLNVGGDGAVSTICDSAGNLQMYGGAFKAFNRLNALMNNSGIVGDSGWINVQQQALAVPKPKDPNIIYYFTSSVLLRYNVIDMRLDNGNGAFVIRNDTLQTQVGVKLAAVHHCNGIDVWVVGHGWGNNRFYAYLIAENGLNTTPIISVVGPKDNTPNYSQGGSIKFSPDGNKLAYTADGHIIPQYIFDFDKSTGVFSNPIQLQKDNAATGLSFSPDNTKLYVGTKNGVLVQYNLEAGDSIAIVSSKKYIYVNSWYSTAYSFDRMQIGRDGKIYVQKPGFPGVDYVGVINNPNVLDTFCDFNPSGLYLNGSNGTSDGIMNTVESYFYTGTSAFPCYGDTTTIDCNDNNVCTIDSYHVATGCIHNPLNCDDSDSCTIDACNPITGCFHTSIANCINGIYTASHNKVSARATPNPFDNFSLIEIKNLLMVNGKVDYRLFNSFGKECKTIITELNAGNGKINVLLHKGQLPPGIYFLAVDIPIQTLTIKLSIF